MSISRPLQAKGTLKLPATTGWMAPMTPMLLTKQQISAILYAREGGGSIPAVENNLASSPGEEGGVRLGGLDVVTAR
jgi:hypothetical protein